MTNNPPEGDGINFPVLHTERLLLREFQEQDATAVFEIFRREDVDRFVGGERMQSFAEAEERVKTRLNLFRNRMGVRWAITLLGNPTQLIGSCGYFNLRKGTETREMGYELHPDYWNRGMITEALHAVLEFAFNTRTPAHVHRMEAIVFPENIPSIRVLEKLGFTCEGIRREFGFWKDRFQDVCLYALLEQEWKGDPK